MNKVTSNRKPGFVKPGRIVIISSPSGGGKSSICRKLLTKARRERGWQFSISYTTRQRRTGERDGREYHFVDSDQFYKLVSRDYFAEHFQVHLYNYGTPVRPLEKVQCQGGVMILDVDVQGAFRLKKKFPDAITIFVLPPSIAELRRRLKRRGTETSEQLVVRFENAKEEMKLFDSFEYAVVNDKLSMAVKQVLCIVESHFCRTERVCREQIKKITG